MSRINWTFTAHDEVVRKHLTAGEILAVKSWQADDGYTFEFHDGHDTGNPIYVRTTDSSVDSNLTKTDTLKKDAPHLVNQDKLFTETKYNPKPIKRAVGERLLALLKAEWPTFKKIAAGHWASPKQSSLNPTATTTTATTGVTLACVACATTYSHASALDEDAGEYSVSVYCKKCDGKREFYPV